MDAAPPAGALAKTLSSTGAVARALDRRRALLRGARLTLLVVLGLVALDAVFPLPAAARFLFLLAGVAALAAAALSFRRRRQAQLNLDHLARMLEETAPDADNALINALQFSRLLARVNRPLSRALMEQEIHRGETALRRVSADRLAARRETDVARERRLLQFIAVAAAATVVCFPRVYLAVVPRYLLPFGDHPPFSFTRFQVTPGDAVVAFGDNLTVTVRTSGQPAHELSLLTSSDRRRWAAAPLFQVRKNEFTQRLEDVQTDLWYCFRADTGRSRRYRVAVLTAPKVLSVDVTCRYPEYTNRKPFTVRLRKEGIRGPDGTEVTLRVTTNRPLAGGRMKMNLRGRRDVTTCAVRPTAADPRVAEATFRLRRSGTFTVDLRGRDGLETPDAVSGKLTLLRDERPLVYITEPGQPSFATPEAQAPIVIEAEDNFGLRALQLHRTVNDSADYPLTRSLPRPAPRRATVRTTLDLADLGVQPGDEITYYATAYDTDPKRRNYADSDVYTLRIISRQQYEELLRAQKSAADLAKEYRDLLAEVDRLREEQEALAGKVAALRRRVADKLSPADRRQLRQLTDQQRKLAQRAADVQKQLEERAKQKPLFDLERDLNRRLQEIARQVARARKAMNEAASKLGQAGTASPPGPPLSQGNQAQQKALRELRQTAPDAAAVRKALEALEKLLPLYEDFARFLALVEAQGDLVLKARAFESPQRLTPEARARLDDLNRGQTQIRLALARIAKDIRAHARQVKRDYPEPAAQAEAFLQQLDSLPIPDHMRSAEEAFGADKGPTGFAEARQALELLRSLLRQARQCRNSANRCLGGSCRKLGMCAGETLGQLCNKLGMGLSFGGGRGGGRSGLPGIGAAGAAMFAPGGGLASGASPAKIYGPQTPAGSRPSSGKRPKKEKKGPTGEQPGDAAPSRVEVAPSAASRPPAVEPPEQERSPAKYKVLIREYFRRVAEESSEGR